MKSMYSMTQEFQILTEMLEDETAPQDEIGKALIALQSDIVTKAENGMAYMSKLEEVIVGAKAEKKRIDAFIKAGADLVNVHVEAEGDMAEMLKNLSIIVGNCNFHSVFSFCIWILSFDL